MRPRRQPGGKSPCSAHAYLLAFGDDTNEPHPWDALIFAMPFLTAAEKGSPGITAQMMDEPGSVADA